MDILPIVLIVIGAAIQLALLYWIIRAAVEAGIAGALKRVNLSVLGAALRGDSSPEKS